MREYELFVVFRPDLDDDSLQSNVDRVTGLVTARGGEVTAVQPRGRRRLYYEIRDFKDGQDVVWRFRFDPARADDLERSLRLTEPVIRHLLVRLDSEQ